MNETMPKELDLILKNCFWTGMSAEEFKHSQRVVLNWILGELIVGHISSCKKATECKNYALSFAEKFNTPGKEGE